MRWLYYLGLAVDTSLLLLAVGNALMTALVMTGDGLGDASDGLTVIGRVALWAIPLTLLGLIVAARRLKARGALVAANVLLWLPGLPLGLGALMWVVLAIIFALSAAR